MSRDRALALAGTSGAALTAVIVAMSVLLRLATRWADGAAVSTLDADVETWARIAHRISAMGVGALAAFALVATVGARPVPRARGWAVAVVVAATAVLAVIGRYTPGYRFDAVTVANVVGGLTLACAFWSLRADAASTPARAPLVALGVLLVAAALGAASSAAAMRGSHDFGPLHLGAGIAFAVLAWMAAWRARGRKALALSITALAAAELASGLWMLAQAGARPIEPAWLHAMAALALALLVVSLAWRR